jgi:hypothetical protein
MRKLCFVLTVLLLTAVAFARVHVVCEQVPDTNQVQVGYVANDDANRPRAFGLDITLDHGATIGDIVSGSASDYYWVYPGTIVISGGSVTEQGTPMAPGDAEGAKGGSGTEGMTIEMGSLYSDQDPEHDEEPPLSDTLFKFTVSGDCNVMIGGNSARGNVVLEDTEPALDVNYSSCNVDIDDECFPSTHTDYSEWLTVGSPDSWCYPHQCYGDTDNVESEYGVQPPPPLPPIKSWVTVEDLQTLLIGYKQTYGGDPLVDTWIAADFDHAWREYGVQPPPPLPPIGARVTVEDLQILLANYKQSGVPGDCLD